MPTEQQWLHIVMQAMSPVCTLLNGPTPHIEAHEKWMRCRWIIIIVVNSHSTMLQDLCLRQIDLCMNFLEVDHSLSNASSREIR